MFAKVVSKAILPRAMKKIAHISDLHFNHIDAQISRSVKRALLAAEPDLLVISGDLTQRAKVREFQAFQEFIREFPIPKIIVPGNHDIPLYDLPRRFLDPLGRYRKYVTPDLSPTYEDDEMVVIGVNSARSYAINKGHLSAMQLKQIERFFDRADASKIRVLVCHHPVRSADSWNFNWIHGIERVNTRIDMILSGHLHQAESEVLSTERMTRTGLNASTLLVRAGTAFSTRMRGEPNSFNLITIQNGEIDVEVLHWAATPPGIAQATLQHYAQDRGRWFSA